ncbi:hypothetical protein ILYODFUR_014264 [Ilyodon furcidens]|uniref:Uncharacterized protein n=1 Tax=Ilyodon furcidens TaxID=33524 RepID=A0ABV0UUP4_9TELE
MLGFPATSVAASLRKLKEEFYHLWMTTRSAEELLCFDGSLVRAAGSGFICSSVHRKAPAKTEKRNLKCLRDYPFKLHLYIKKKKSDAISFFLVVGAVQWLIKWRSLVFEVFCTK